MKERKDTLEAPQMLSMGWAPTGLYYSIHVCTLDNQYSLKPSVKLLVYWLVPVPGTGTGTVHWK